MSENQEKKDMPFMTDGPGMAYDPNRTSPMGMMNMGMSMSQAQAAMSAAGETACASVTAEGTCSNCGGPVTADDTFCGKCGSRLK